MQARGLLAGGTTLGNPARVLVRAGVVLSTLPTSLLVSTTPGAAVSRAEQAAEADAGTVPFGLFGPVGLVAIVLGVVGMVAGVLRQRRRARAAEEAERAASQETTRPVLAPVDASN